MGSKIKSFIVVIMYMLIAVVVQLSVAMIGGIIVSIRYFIKQDPQGLQNLNDIQTIELLNEIIGSMNYILLASSIITVLIFVLIYKLRKKNVSKEVQLNGTKSFNYAIALLLGVSVWLFNVGFVSLLSYGGLFPEAFQSMENNTSFITDTNILVSLLVVGIVAPFAEEFLFRGMIFKTLSKSISITAVIIIQGVLFGVYHMNLVQGIYAALLGIVFGYVTYKTKSLWPAIIMHMANNIMATLSPLILGDSFESLASFLVLLLGGFIISTVGILLINKNNLKSIENTQNIEV